MYRIAVDIGGTFTDGVVENVTTGTVWVAKALSTPASPGEAVTKVIGELLLKAGLKDPSSVVEVVHGNTIVSNTLIERKGVATALLTTEGMTDLIEMGREVRYDLYDLRLELPPPLVPAGLRIGVRERMTAAGQPELPLTDEEIDRVAASLEATNARSVAISLLHANVSPEHELRLEEAIRKKLPAIAVSSSAKVAGEIREYERTTTATANAYVQPLVESYLRELEFRLQAIGIKAPIRIMVSSGGFTSSSAAADFPINLLESGPAGGAISAAHVGKAAGIGSVLAFDMGGTTAKLCVIIDGEPAIAHSFETARVHRFKRGSGLPILIPSIDLIEIGAGGGSIAKVNQLGLIKVGPESAGSVPGPACYALGGAEPTVTDADLALGYLDPANFLGGEMHLDVEGAMNALGGLGVEVGLDAFQTAVGIIDIVNESMAAAARVHIAEKGHDPRQFTMIATGGAGPVHAASVAKRLGLSRLAFPVAVGAGSCLGFLAAPPRADRAWSKISSVNAVDWTEVAERLARLRSDAEEEISGTGTSSDSCNWSIIAEMRFGGQGAAVPVQFPYRRLTADDADELVKLFTDKYGKLYGCVIPAARPEVVTWRVSATGINAHGSFIWPSQPRSGVAPKGYREVYLPDEKAKRLTPVYDRYSLAPGTQLAGPAIIEERESTLNVPYTADIDVLDDRTIVVNLAK